MKIEKDFKELLRLFNKHNVRYCIIGSFALAFYHQPRYTKDLDILVEPSFENGEKIMGALKEFGFGSLHLSPEDFCHEERVVQLGYEPVRVDLLTSIKGLNFNEIWQKKVQGKYGALKVFFIGLDEFVKSKTISNRPQDVADLDKLFKKKKRPYQRINHDHSS